MSSSTIPDNDDDLRSLLSGSTTNSNSITNPRKKNARSSRMDQYITHLDQLDNNSLESVSVDNNSNSNTTNRSNHGNNSSSRTNSSTGQNNSRANSHSPTNRDTMVTPVTPQPSPPRVPSGNRLLYLLGSSLIAFAIFGPTSPLLFTDSPPSVQHGDKHHTLHKLPEIKEEMNGIKATGSRKHDKFGSRNKATRNRQGNNHYWKYGNNYNNEGKDGRIHSNIKEAIDNIDKVFLGKAPRNKGLRKEAVGDKRNKKKVDNSDVNAENGKNANTEDDDLFPGTATTPATIPVIHADDDTLPSNAEALDAYTNSLPASDALECRASVIAFVINATDVRDECEGLRKAFDKTCSVNSGVVADKSSSGGAVTGRRRLKSWGMHRILSNSWENNVDWSQYKDNLPDGWENIDWSEYKNNVPSGWNQNNENNNNEDGNWVETAITWFWRFRLGIQAWQSWVSRWVGGNSEDAFLFSEEEVAADRIWNEAKQMVEMGVNLQTLAEDYMYKPWNGKNTTLHHRRLNDAVDPNAPSDAGKSLISIVEERKEEDANGEEKAPVVVKKEEEKPISLLIPTGDEHLSEELLNDALLLQEAKDDPKPAPVDPIVKDEHQPQQSKEDAPQLLVGNNTASEEAARDAAESANSIRTATDAVKNMMMDPKSVEARTCCASILSVFHEHCDPSTTGIEDYSDRKLLVIVFVVTVCGIVKSVIRYFNIRWLPEAGGCILVGVMGYLILQNVSYVQYAFDGDMFLRIMVPPIVFEAAVKINKRSFQRHVIPITIYAIVGTLASTALTAAILYKGSALVGWCPTIPIKESLIFGSLISSIDPIAVLSVLNNMGMTDSDTIYVLIFGESLLNDGIAIVLFQTLVHFLDESLVIDGEAVLDAIMHFVVVALGSLTVGVASGACATIYFAIMHGMQTPMVELISFLAWAFIPYFICDMVEWSGIVAIVANGFVMDLYIVGQRNHISGSTVDDEIDFLVHGNANGSNSPNSNSNRGRSNAQQYRSFFNYEGHLSPLANTHVHFVIEIFATLMETAIFAYLGLFLFSSRYHWNKYLTIISIFATVMGRVVMIPMLSYMSNIINRMLISRSNRPPCIPRTDNNENVHVDHKMQIVLIFAGLRGAMSFALVEHIPLFDTITGQGSRLKPELKAMTSASIIFTVFVLGGATSYLMERIGYSINPKQEIDAIEVTPLVRQGSQGKPSTPNAAAAKRNEISSRHRTTSSNSVRQRGSGSTR
ncbi:hypothetical protein ACHAXN_007796 [Cyclotella atomus]